METKFLAGEKSAIGSLDRPPRKTTWSNPRRSSNERSMISLLVDGHVRRQIGSEPKKVRDLYGVASLDQVRYERAPDIACTIRD